MGKGKNKGQEPQGQEPQGQEPQGQEPKGQEPQGQEPNNHISTDELLKLKEKIQSQDEYIDEARQKDAYIEAITNIKGRDESFDEGAVLEYLTKLNETDEAKAKELNNPSSWELIWNSIKPKEPNNDPFDSSSSRYQGSTPDEQQKILESVKSGDTTIADEQSVLADLL